jgi:hypothetical protein
MIHLFEEGGHLKLGLNLSKTPGGFVAIWAWYDFATRTAFRARFRLRLHQAPRILWSVDRFNVIDNYLELHGLELVDREVLEDLNLTEASVKRQSAWGTYIKSYAAR